MKWLAILVAVAVGVFVSVMSRVYHWTLMEEWIVGAGFAAVVGLLGSVLIVLWDKVKDGR